MYHKASHLSGLSNLTSKEVFQKSPERWACFLPKFVEVAECSVKEMKWEKDSGEDSKTRRLSYVTSNTLRHWTAHFHPWPTKEQCTMSFS